jgi:CRISPR-associated protein Cas1
MSNYFYILKNGKLIRKANTVYFVSENSNSSIKEKECFKIEDSENYEDLDLEIENISPKPEYIKKALPVEKIDAIFAYGRVSLSSGVISFFSKKQIPVHFFGYYGHYENTLLPKEALLSGYMHVNQASHFIDNDKRLFIAKKFVEGSKGNILKNLEYYLNQGKEVDYQINHILDSVDTINSCKNIQELMAIEGNIRSTYYSAFDEIIDGAFEFGSRTKRPPQNPLNALISFGNSLVYTATINAIYHTQLDQTISFLHEPSERRFSLSLDVSEIFKPLFVDRTIFKLINKGMIQENDFDQNVGSCILNDEGRRKFLAAFDEKMNTTIKHRTLKRNVSYKRLIYLECLKLAKHVTNLKSYEPFRIWW